MSHFEVKMHEHKTQLMPKMEILITIRKHFFFLKRYNKLYYITFLVLLYFYRVNERILIWVIDIWNEMNRIAESCANVYALDDSDDDFLDSDDAEAFMKTDDPKKVIIIIGWRHP